jgi:hypothetical protein
MPRVRERDTNFNKPSAFSNGLIVLAVQTSDMYACLPSNDQTMTMQMALTS